MATVLRDLRQHRVQVERSRFLARRELDEVLDLRRHRRLHQVNLGDVIDQPIKVELRALEWIAAQIEDQRQPQFHQRLCPLHQPLRALNRQVELIVADPDRHELPVVAEVHDLVSRALLHRPGQIRNKVVAVEMDLEGLLSDGAAIEQLLLHVRIAGGGQQGREQVDVGADAIEDRTALILPGQRRNVGTRQAPSQLVSFCARNGVLPPSGQVSFSGPLSVEYMTMVLSAW
jgi:hypothetical protein